MDRFKFRVWDSSAKAYVPRSQFILLSDGTLIQEIGGEEVIWESTQPEFCTGLKDKNGKLIYEGDWLKTKDGSYCYVVWYDGFLWVKSLPSEAMDLEYAEFYKECEVVGNIHENADLLDNEDA